MSRIALCWTQQGPSARVAGEDAAAERCQAFLPVRPAAPSPSKIQGWTFVCLFLDGAAVQEETFLLVHLGNLEIQKNHRRKNMHQHLTRPLREARTQVKPYLKVEREFSTQGARSGGQAAAGILQRPFQLSHSVAMGGKNNLARCQKPPIRNSSFLCLCAINTPVCKG